MAGISVIKIGGVVVADGDTTIADMVSLQQRGYALVIVHGGGKLITEWLTRQGIATRFVHGERVTDAAALPVVTALLAGLVNKEIVAAVNNAGGKAVGISGADGGLIRGSVKDRDLGYVGEVRKINPELVQALLGSGYLVVVAPLGLNSGDKPDSAGGLLNINADTAAGEIAAAISAERLVFLTDVNGIADGSGRVLPVITPGEAEGLIDSGVASGGMIPKIRACLRALDRVASARIIDGRPPHALLREMEGKGGGTTISGR